MARGLRRLCLSCLYFRVPIDKIIEQLSLFFSPDKVENGYSLSIVQGQDGARLTHSHERQYNFALQSMTLWRCVSTPPSHIRWSSLDIMWTAVEACC